PGGGGGGARRPPGRPARPPGAPARGAPEPAGGLPAPGASWTVPEPATSWTVPEAASSWKLPGVAEAAPDPAELPPGWTQPPYGVHRLHVRAPDHHEATATLVVAPARVPQPPERTHGFLVQLYSLLSARSWGMGDLGDLADLAAWAGRTLGSGFIQVNPLHAAVPGKPTDPSPY
ncbi:4-alpha-glucanotransferase, partial [Streptomyces cyaneofuscatus]|uniref:4-alpha-glucanotransferase n=1 Tax=Streptomyces cyaneofuscatus TaxID=66883 RepID=UPI002FF25BCB